jgi:hypothetical protein
MAQPDAFEERLFKRQLLTFRWTDTLRATSPSRFSQEESVNPFSDIFMLKLYDSAEKMLQAIDYSVEMAQDGKHLCSKAIDSKVLESLSSMKNMQDLAVAGRRRSEQVAGCLAKIDGNTVPQELISGVMDSVIWWRMVETNTSMVVRLMSSLPDVQPEGQKAVKTKEPQKGLVQQWKDTKPQWKETMSQWESLSSTVLAVNPATFDKLCADIAAVAAR